MIPFKQLFSFSQTEIKEAFANAKLKDKIFGFKLLQAPTDHAYGKLLIVTPRKVGKACKRNKIRRRVKSIFYEERLFKIPANSILLVYKPANDINFEQIKAFLKKNLT